MKECSSKCGTLAYASEILKNMNTESTEKANTNQTTLNTSSCATKTNMVRAHHVLCAVNYWLSEA